MAHSMPASETVKEQVTDQVPKKIKELKFGIFNIQDILNQSVLEVCDRSLYDIDRDRAPRSNGPLDTRLGITSRGKRCDTCGSFNSDCNGHFGHVRLALPAFHIGYLKAILKILQQICKECAKILLPEDDRRIFLRDLRRPHVDNLRKTAICRKVLEKCKKARRCEACGAINGAVKRAGPPLKLIHDKYKAYNSSTSAKKQPPRSKVQFEQSFEEIKKSNGEVEKHLKKAVDDLNPLRVLRLFQKVIPGDCLLLGLDPVASRPEVLIWQYVPAPPVVIRPSVAQDNASTEDDITQKLSDVIHISTLIREGLSKGTPLSQIMEQWDFLQLQIALYINSDVPGLQQQGFPKSIRGFCQRLKGKQGRFRGNLSGKRVDFSGRTVISPDPNLGIDEVAIPELVARTLTYPERVTSHNIHKLRHRVENGPYVYPGATYLIDKHGQKLSLKFKKPSTLNVVEVGAVVERHLEDGDIVLFNRQPSLHKLSILSHRVKVRPHRTFRLNECVCTPYNADFDGDEMNLHVPQTEESRAEANELMGVRHNLATPKNGEPIISAIQDFITGAYLLSSKDVFYDRATFANICMQMLNADSHLDLPPPTIIKPQALWTGKQVFNVLMRPNKQSNILVNLDAACREYKNVPGRHHDLDENDMWLCIRNSEVMCGRMDKSTVGAGKKSSVFYVILRDFGADAAVEAMNRLARLSARWLTEQGFSIGISDVYADENLVKLKADLVDTAYAKCDDLIVQCKEGKLLKKPGCDELTTLENELSGILNQVRGEAGELCIERLSKRNSALIMATSGSKGSKINVSQMVAVVGQQIIGGKRVEDGFQDRSLPHFPKHARQPPSKGFVKNGFFNGLSPSEFIFHAMSGREGLVDTAVKTAETGYMSRRLMKSLEDLSTQYDDTVRNSSSAVVQFKYGDDQLDPVDMEGSAKPVHFDRTFSHCEAITWNNKERSLLPAEAQDLCNKMLEKERGRLPRHSLLGEILEYKNQSTVGNGMLDNNRQLWTETDQRESARDFLDSIEDFVGKRIEKHIQAVQQYGTDAKRRSKQKKNAEADRAVEHISKLSRTCLVTFIDQCLKRYRRAKVEPGHAVGAVGAQSIGEPGTQMTLKTFHFAGVAGMSITEGVPRIKEIINASRRISTPVIACELENKRNVIAARVVKGRIEKTYLKDVIMRLDGVWHGSDCCIDLQLNREAIDKLQLDITPSTIRDAIIRQRKLKINLDDISILRYGSSRHDLSIRVLAQETSAKIAATVAKARSTTVPTELFQRCEALMRVLPEIVIVGYPDCSRAVIAKKETRNEDSEESYQVLVEGYGLRACMSTIGVDGKRTKTNSVMETRDVLGIEAARASIVEEMAKVLRDMDIDPRHLQLLADVMTQRGEVLGITRFGMGRMRDSVLQLASFEKTPDHLFEAATGSKSDRIEGVSECVIMGQSIGLGTGGFGLVRGLAIEPGDIGPRETTFEDVWKTVRENMESRHEK